MRTSNGKTIAVVLPIRNTVIFPGQTSPLRVGRAKSVAGLKYASENDQFILLVSQLDPNPHTKESLESIALSELCRIGTLGKIERIRGGDEGTYQIVVRGMYRVKIEEYFENNGFIEARFVEYPEVKSDRSNSVELAGDKSLLESLKKISLEILELVPADTRQLAEMVKGIEDLSYLSFLCAANLELAIAEKQKLLEIEKTSDRVVRLLELMRQQRDQLQVQSDIREKLTHKIGKTQRDSILREQLKAIREELGEADEKGDDLRQRIESANMPPDVLKVATTELNRLEQIGAQSPESHVIRNYLDLLCSMPWSQSSVSEIDLDQARAQLEADHYGLDKIKKRILQNLAVMKLRKTSKGSILLLVGPPGVGKTSLGQSIAKALGRKFARVSLGGVRDDAEIRGHRRTYIGAMPGRIVQALKRAGENNPVMMLDEIDKLSRSFSGDPAGALLEVLDPEQNSNFMDHYLDVPFDLSKVVFIGTANSLEGIPAPLLDRLEVIEVSGYTSAEKLHIAKNHLWPKQLEEHGLNSSQVHLTDDALFRVINHYTREAGVRELQRKLAEICRASSEEVLHLKEGESVQVGARDLDELLGPERFTHEVAERLAPPGVVTGLAWTPQGGEILFIEASLMPGKGSLVLTGQLGEVMKESAQIALSLVKSRMPAMVAKLELEKKDIHVHIPAGAIPKDGPSAGVTMVATLASLLSGRSVNPKLAMTGEVTLRGMVMPVGGIKEKVLAAHRAGIERVIISKKNEKDLRDVPEEVRQQMKFELVETVSDLLKVAIDLELEPLSNLIGMNSTLPAQSSPPN